MLYYLFTYLREHFRLPGGGLFEFLSFRAALAFLLSILISLVFGKRIIRMLQRKQVGEEIRNLGLAGQIEKRGTPTMGGLIILAAVLIPTLLMAALANVYIWLILVATVGLGMIGFIDDYIKVFKKNKQGLAGKFKLMGQIVIGLIVGATLFFNSGVVLRDNMPTTEAAQRMTNPHKHMTVVGRFNRGNTEFAVTEHKSTKTTIPFVKSNEFDYAKVIAWIGDNYEDYAWIIYIPVVRRDIQQHADMVLEIAQPIQLEAAQLQHIMIKIVFCYGAGKALAYVTTQAHVQTFVL
jgi:phospho-N-acetylmuramoyl-pentapeptide-transferase